MFMSTCFKKNATFSILGFWIISANTVFAAGNVDKVYDPYVQPLEKEIEYRALGFKYDDPESTIQRHKLGFGYSPVEAWFVEGYLIGEGENSGSLDLAAIEIEAKFQMTEQGEYDSDWGLIFEIEHELDPDFWEIATGILVTKDTGQFTHTGNFKLAIEWGSEIASEVELEGAFQSRYRWSRYFEPGVEYFIDDNERSLGVIVQGDMGNFVGQRNKLFWNLGWFAGLNDETPDQTLRLMLEFEFF